MSGERTIHDPVEEIVPPTAAGDATPAPKRQALGRLPPTHELLSRLGTSGAPAPAVAPTISERTVTDPVEEVEPQSAAAEPGRPRLGRLPPTHELLSRVSLPDASARAAASGERTLSDPVEELDPDTAAIEPPLAPAPGQRPHDASPAPPRPPPPPAPRSVPVADTVADIAPRANSHRPAPPRSPAAPASADTVAAVPRPAETVRDLSHGAPDAAAGAGPPPAGTTLPMPPPGMVPSLVTVERPSVATAGEDSATYYCQTCKRRVPGAEIQVLTRDGRKAFTVCPVCNGYLGAGDSAGSSGAPRVESTPRAAGAPRSQTAAPRSSLERTLVEAIGWPFTRQVLPTLLGLTCVFWLLSSAWALGLAPVAIAGLTLPAVTIAGLTLGLAVLAVRAAAVIDATHRGEVAPPALLGDEPGTVLRHLAVLFVGGLPLLAALGAGALGVRSPSEHTMRVVAGAAAFCLYAPAGHIVVASLGTFGAALNPLRPIRFAFRLGSAYLLPCAILLGIAIAHLVAIGVTMMVGVAIFGGPTVGWGLLVSLVVVTGVLVEARVLGLVVREHRFDLALV